jgi:hypothetical protein
MGTRKFYYGDIAEINGLSQTRHTGHKARVVATRIYINDNVRHNAIYDVDCECGQNLRLSSWKMNQVDTPVSMPKTKEEACTRHFLETTGIRGVGQLNKSIEHLDPRSIDIVRRRFGLNSEGQRESLQRIADSYGLTKERIRQISVLALRSLPGGRRAGRTVQV